MRGARVGVLAVVLVAAALVLRIAYVNDTPGYGLRHDAVDYDVHARSIAQGEGFSKTLAHGRPTAFRPPGYPYFLGAVYHVFKADRKPVKERVHVARIAQAFVGAALVALVGVIAAQLWGTIAALVALGLGAIYLPLILVGGAVMSEPLFDVFMLASLAAVLAYRRSSHRYAWALAAGVLGGLAALTRAQALILLIPLAIAVWDGRP
jgi:4-amino-4-deoxy-L-arabinose transferase-like glycosyltransferase